ncbi:MAG: DUF2963 domain-containing protein [Candidatus Gastranaerophilaceae bacterium]
MSVNQVDLGDMEKCRLKVIDGNGSSVRTLHTPKQNATTPLKNDNKSTLLNLQKQYIFSLKDAVRTKKINGECIFHQNGRIFCIQVKNHRNRVIKAYILNDNEDRIISISNYNPDNGKVIRTVLYHEEKLTVSSVKEYDLKTGNPSKTTFFKEDGKTVSSILEYSEFSDDIKYTLVCDDGELITSII